MLGNDDAPEGWIEVQRDDDARTHESDEHAAIAVARAAGVGVVVLFESVSGAATVLDMRAGEEGTSLLDADARAALERHHDPHWIVMVPGACLAR